MIRSGVRLFSCSFPFIFLCCFFSVLFPVDNANAVARLQSGCTPFRTDNAGTGLDGSDCDMGLVCDKQTRICAYPTEVPCDPVSSACATGMVCMSDDGNILSTGGIGAGSGSGLMGTCVVYAGGSLDNNPLTYVLCYIFMLATGTPGKICFAIVIIAVGAGTAFGKFEVKTMILTAGGMGLAMGAQTIVLLITGRGFTC